MLVKITALVSTAALIVTPASATWTFQGQWPDPYNINILNGPNGIAASSDDTFYVSDTNHHRVWFVNVIGPQQFYWGSYGSGPGEFIYPQGLALTPENLVYVVDTENRRVQIFTPRGSFLGSWPTPETVTLPTRLAVAPNGNVYMPFGSTVFYFTAAGSLLGSWGGFGSGPGEFKYPQGLAVGPDGTVYVVDLGNNRIQYFTASGSYLGQWGNYGSNFGEFKNPSGVAVSAGFYVFVTDAGNRRVQQFTRDGSFISTWGSYGTGPGQFVVPDAVSVSPDGDVVYVADRGYSRVQWFREEITAVTPASFGRAKALFR